MLMKIRMPQLMLWLTTVLTSSRGLPSMWITAITTTDRIAQKVMPKLLKALTQAVSLNILSTPGRIHMITVTKNTTAVVPSRSVMGPCFLTTFSILKSLNLDISGRVSRRTATHSRTNRIRPVGTPKAR